MVYKKNKSCTTAFGIFFLLMHGWENCRVRALETSIEKWQRKYSNLYLLKFSLRQKTSARGSGGINPTNSEVIPQNHVLRSTVLGWILIYRYRSSVWHFQKGNEQWMLRIHGRNSTNICIQATWIGFKTMSFTVEKYRTVSKPVKLKESRIKI